MANTIWTAATRGLMVAATVALVGLLTFPAAAQTAAAKKGPVERAIVGTVETVDTTAKTVAVKTSDGAVQVFKVTEKTTVTGLKEGAKYSALAAEQSIHVVVRYTQDAGTKTADAIDTFGTGADKIARGTVVAVNEKAKTVTVKSENGAEEVFDIADRAVVDTGTGVVKQTQKGAKVTVEYTERAGKKIAHFIRSL
jgi:hypothetical protein